MTRKKTKISSNLTERPVNGLPVYNVVMGREKRGGRMREDGKRIKGGCS